MQFAELKGQILDKISSFYLSPKDSFNGISLSLLKADFKLSDDDLKDIVRELVSEKKVTLVFVSLDVNPHIKRRPDLTVRDQLTMLDKKNVTYTCVYPAREIIESRVDVSEYDNRPFTRRLLLGEAMLVPVYFELSVLERYSNDPRYDFAFEDFGGQIGVPDAFFSDKLKKRDKVFLKTFGLGFNSAGLRVAVVFLRYLSKMTPEHQQHWNTYIEEEGCWVVPAYAKTNISGEMVQETSAYTAFLEELRLINSMANAIRGYPLFRDDFESKRPQEFSPFLRPTSGNFNSFVLFLHKMLSENLNSKFLKREMKSGDSGTLPALGKYLREISDQPKDATITKIMQTLRDIRKKRQVPAHKIVDNKYDEKYYGHQNELMAKVYVAIRGIRQIIQRQPKASSIEIPKWLQECEIVLYGPLERG